MSSWCCVLDNVMLCFIFEICHWIVYMSVDFVKTFVLNVLVCI